jgi:formate-dependent phosphoribosylglycinamide formyltransferase (GAR transformylase)
MGFRDRELASMAGKMSSRVGVPNRATNEVRKAFQLLVEANLPQMQSDLDELEPKDRIRFILEMAKFILPTLQAVSVDDLRENEAEGFNVLTINLTTNGNDTDN